jgi:ferredoxin
MERTIAHRFQVDQRLCIRCGECVSDCPVNILVVGDEPPAVAEGREGDCIGCQHCLAICPTGAVSVLGLQASDSLTLENNYPSYSQLEHLVKGRRSIRRFLDENVDPDLIRQALETAWYAPSGRNNRRVQFNVVDDKDIMHRVRGVVMQSLAKRAEQEGLPAGYGFFGTIVKGWQEYQVDTIFRWAPHLLITSAPPDCSSPDQDMMIALSYFELICQSLVIGTLWNGLAKMSLNLVPELRTMLTIPEDHVVGFAMSFGRPAMTYTRSVQYPQPLINRIELPAQ